MADYMDPDSDDFEPPFVEHTDRVAEDACRDAEAGLVNALLVRVTVFGLVLTLLGVVLGSVVMAFGTLLAVGSVTVLILRWLREEFA